jgi:hypothetical protein
MIRFSSPIDCVDLSPFSKTAEKWRASSFHLLKATRPIIVAVGLHFEKGGWLLVGCCWTISCRFKPSWTHVGTQSPIRGSRPG